eukprot:XP_016660336.1 PREDICTED: leucine-rich repeat extensin-like protein 3 [Acyrthosiphon pisum]
MCTPPPIRQTSPQPDAVVGEPEDNDDTLHFRYYVGPALFCTQPMPPPASAIIAAKFSYPPPPLPEYYIGPTVFDIMGPPPLACCVVASRFSYPPPPPPCRITIRLFSKLFIIFVSYLSYLLITYYCYLCTP